MSSYLSAFILLTISISSLRLCSGLENDHSNSSNTTSVHSILEDVEKCVTLAAEHIQSGHVIAIPTDTIYGLAADAQNVKAIEKLYRIKSRDSSKALAICVPNVQSINQWGHAEHLSEKMLNVLLPGPVTILLNRTCNLNSQLNPDKEKVAIRIPKYDFLLKLMAALKKPIALSSANKSGEQSSVNVGEFSFLWTDLDAVFDGGTTGTARNGSTIVDLSSKGECKIIREGGYLNSTLMVLHEYGLCNV